MEKSENIEKLSAALAKAQGDFTTPPKDKEVAYKQTKYKFANLATIIEHNKKSMVENGLAITQVMSYKGEHFGLETVLTHSSGQFISSFHPLPDPSKMPPQDFGSKLTYSRRYSYQTIQGVEAEQDDDGALAQREHKAPAAKPAPKNHAPTSRLLNKKEIESLWGRLNNEFMFSPGEVKQACLALYNRPGLGKLTLDDAKDLMARAEKDGKSAVLEVKK